MTNWEQFLSNITDRYNPADIYNADKTGIFLNLVSDKNQFFKCPVSLLVCAIIDGSDKLPLLIIGKSAKPRCFKGVKLLPTEYQSNKKHG